MKITGIQRVRVSQVREYSNFKKIREVREENKRVDNAEFKEMRSVELVFSK